MKRKCYSYRFCIFICCLVVFVLFSQFRRRNLPNFFESRTNRVKNVISWPGWHEHLPSLENQQSSLEAADVNKFYNASSCIHESRCGKGPCRLKSTSENTFECSHFIYIKTSRGRTGNQLFRVSTLIGTAMYHGYTAVIHPSFPLTQHFDLPNVINIPFTNVKTFQRKTLQNYDEGIKHLDHSYNWTIDGFMHSWRYFEGAEAAIRSALRLKASIVIKARTFLRSVIPNGTIAVGVHVRRGDRLHKKFQDMGYTVAPISYVREATERFRKKYRRVAFIAVCEDKTWCRDNMGWDKVTMSPFEQPEHDFAVLTLCDHAVITTGSYGWWGAWLTGGEVVYWTGYPRPGSELANRTNHFDLYPREWIGLP